MYRVDFSKGRNWKEEEGIRSQVIPKSHKVNNIRSWGLRIILFGLILCFPDPMGWSHLCRYDRWGWGSQSQSCEGSHPPSSRWPLFSLLNQKQQTSHPWTWGGSSSDLWITFVGILPLPWRTAHMCSYLAPQSSSVGSKKSDSLPSFCAGVADQCVVHTHTSLIKLLATPLV